MTAQGRLRLGVNIDHVATLRNARGGTHPDPVEAARVAVQAGADGITAHLREDRRHVRDDDIARLRAEFTVPLNFEMGVTEEMVAIALQVCPHAACLVPERREERTTEGGLDVVRRHDELAPMIGRLSAASIRVSLFIEADNAALDAARRLGSPVVELHTGAYCEAVRSGARDRARDELERLRRAARHGARLGLEIHMGHGLDYDTAETVSTIAEVAELNIGHFLVGEAVFAGLEPVIRRMRAAMDKGRPRA